MRVEKTSRLSMNRGKKGPPLLGPLLLRRRVRNV